MPTLENTLKELKRSRNLQKMMEEGAVQPQELLGVIKALVKHISDYKNQISSIIGSEKRNTEGELKKVRNSLNQKEKSLRSSIDVLEKKLKTDTKWAQDALVTIQESISNIYEAMPSEFDPSSLRGEIDNIRRRIEELPKHPDYLEEFERIDDIGDALEEMEEKLNELKSIKTSGGGGGMHRSHITDIDLSSQLDGSKKTFNIQAVYGIISVSLSSYPYGALRKGIDYTHTNTTITFTDEIDAETQLASGQKCIITAVNA